MSDLVTLVNEQDEVVGQMDKIEAHRGSGVLHRAISVFLFDTSGKVLLQQRSKKKIVGALQWANTCCGNVRPDETHLECAHRRLKEELGIIGNNIENGIGRGEVPLALHQVTRFQYQVRCNEEFSENEIDTVYVGRYDGTVTPNPDEVAEYTWMPWDEFVNAVSDEQTYVPWVREMKKFDVFEKIENSL